MQSPVNSAKGADARCETASELFGSLGGALDTATVLRHSVNNAGANLSRAIETANFEAARSLILDYRTEILAELSFAATQDDREQVAAHAVESLTRYLHLARAVRSHICAQFRTNSGSTVYQASHDERHTMQALG